MGKILRLRNFFKTKEKPLSFKRAHFLNQLSTPRLEEILLYSENDHTSRLWPKLENQHVAFLNDQKHKTVLNKIILQNPKLLLNTIYNGGDVLQEQQPDCVTVYSDIEHLAFRRNHIAVVICPFILEEFETAARFIQHISTFMDNGSRLILSLRHPQLENILYNQNPDSLRVVEATLAKYHNLLKQCALYTEELAEGVVDLSVKAFFTDSEFDYYHEYKNTPLSLVLRTVKFIRK